MQTDTIKLRAGDYLVKTTVWQENNRLFFQFPFNRPLMAEIKAMRGSKYHGYDEVNPRKLWSIEICPHNDFQLGYLSYDSRIPGSVNPYERYNSPLIPIPIHPRFNKSKGKELSPLKHQPLMTAHMVQRRRCIVAGEMGTTKTFCCLTALEILSGEFLQKHGFQAEIWYVAPRSALRAVEREFLIWGSALDPKFMTYEEMTKKVRNWESGTKTPAFIVFDESSKLKTPTSQRTQSAQALADGCRKDWGEDAVVLLMTGTPAPKSPSDWYSQAEIACPGFLKEGDIFKFNQRLGIIVQKENFQGGGTYPHLVTWRDNEKKCNVCGEMEDHPKHSPEAELMGQDGFHKYVPSKNEIEYLYKRLKGLVIVFFKKDCLDLPDKTYREIEVKPSPSVLRAASLITKAAKTVIEGLTRLRELSDGFQYVKEKGDKIQCQRCLGHKKVNERIEIPDTCPQCRGRTDIVCMNHLPQYDIMTIDCPRCGGSGEEDDIVRNTKEVACPKDQVLIDLLDEYEDVGRVVIFAGFTAAIDRCVRTCQKQGWIVIRLDQGKEQVLGTNGASLGISDYLSLFQDRKEEYPRVAFIAHPGSGGMGLTLTASPVIIYYSNDFNGEFRSQSEDRIHRPGMDVNLGALIIDLIHLPTDRKVLVNLKNKRNLELMSLGELGDELKTGAGHAET